ncbi:hypothetical protein NPIL_680041, partial [Nephila pilipes]
CPNQPTSSERKMGESWNLGYCKKKKMIAMKS